MLRLTTLSLLTAIGICGMALGQSRSKKEPDFTQPYASDKVHFSAVFTEKPRTVTRKHESRAGTILVTTVSVETRDLIYAISEAAYPDMAKDADAKKLLNAAADGLSAKGGKVISRETITMTGPNETKVDALEVVVQYGTNRIRTRLCVSGTNLIQASVTGSEKNISSTTAEKFLRAVEVK